MDQKRTERALENLDRRMTHVEQILPTLATREEMRAAIAEAIAPLPTRDEMQRAIAEATAPLPTRDEMQRAIREEGERTRCHFDVVAEGLADRIGVIAEGHGALTQRLDRFEVEVKGDVASLDRRVTSLEAARSRARGRR